MNISSADGQYMYPSFDTRHLIGALALLAALIVLPWFGCGPLTWQQSASVDESHAEASPASQAALATPTAPVASPVPSAPPPVAPKPVATVPAPVVQSPPAPVADAAPAAPSPAPITPAPVPPRAIVYFGFDSDNLRADGRRRLAAIAAFLQEHPEARVRISGYHDARGELPYNVDLAARRALAVRAALEHAGVARDRIIVARPARTTGSGAPEKARRTEVIVEP